jgi:predicted small lipoprotein YifL
MNYKKHLFPGLIAVLFAVFILTGCEQKRETPEEGTQTPVDTATQQTPQTTDTVVKEAEEIPNLTGEWTGEFGDRKMTLNIVSQDSSTFAGETVVRWDSPLTEKVTGEVNFDTREMKIKETAGKRSNGTYTGTITADMKNFRGTWTDNGKRRTYNVTLTKQ